MVIGFGPAVATVIDASWIDRPVRVARVVSVLRASLTTHTMRGDEVWLQDEAASLDAWALWPRWDVAGGH